LHPKNGDRGYPFRKKAGKPDDTYNNLCMETHDLAQESMKTHAFPRGFIPAKSLGKGQSDAPPVLPYSGLIRRTVAGFS